MSAAADRFTVYARITAKVLHALGPIIRAARDGETNRLTYEGSLFVYPHEDGVLCLATDGRALAAFIDRSGKTSGEAQFCIPDDLIDACAPPEPISGFYCGDYGEFQLPSWAQPGAVMLSASGAVVSPQMPHPQDVEAAGGGHALFHVIAEDGNRHRDEDYRARAPAFDPRRVFTACAQAGEAPVLASPRMVGLFSDCARVLAGPNCVTSIKGTGLGHVAIRFDDCPDFIGLIAPLMAPETELILPPFERFAASVAAVPQPATDEAAR